MGKAGAVNGKHIRIAKPAARGSYFYNHRGHCSVVLLATVNTECDFIYASVSCNGRNSDAGVIKTLHFMVN
jgi:hypothetical protein